MKEEEALEVEMRRGAMGIVGLGVLTGLLALSPVAGTLSGQEEDRDERADRGDAFSGMLVTAGAQQSYLGVRIADVDDEDVERLGLSEERGVLIREVVEETPAAEAGLREDDVILAWNGESLESVAELRRHLRETPAGRSVRLTVVRDGSERDVELTTGERGGMLRRAFRLDRDRMEELEERMRERAEEGRARVRTFSFFGRPRMGVGLQSLSDQLADYFGVEEGALVSSVEEDSPAAEAGLRAGDVILAIGGETVEDPGDVVRILADREAGPVEVRVMRDRSERTLTVELEEPEERSGLLRSGSGVWVFPDEGRSWNFRWPEDEVRVRIPRIEVDADPLRFDMRGLDLDLSPLRLEMPRLDLDLPPLRVDPPPVEVEAPELGAPVRGMVEIAT